ncbi:MAG: hypothetical protein V1750_03865, partial [Acidobacteriota bacterium]
MSGLRSLLARGLAQRVLAGAAMVCALAMIAGLVVVVGRVAGAFFWPSPVVELTLVSGERLLGEEAGS